MEQSLVQYGVLGIMCAWFMWRVESRLDRLSTAIVLQTRGNMLMLLDHPTTSDPVKTQARELLAEIATASRPAAGAALAPR